MVITFPPGLALSLINFIGSVIFILFCWYHEMIFFSEPKPPKLRLTIQMNAKIEALFQC